MTEQMTRNGGLGISLQSILLILVGFIVFGLNYFLMDYAKQSFPTHSKFIELLESFIQALALMIISISVIVLICKKYFLFAWENYLSKPLDSFLEITEKNLSIVSEKTIYISENIDTYIKKRGGPLTIHECKSRDDYTGYLNHACSNIYGIHSTNPKSLYSQIKTRLLDTFCCEPHQSNVKKRIRISNTSTNPEFIHWHEVTEYRIHHVTYGIHATTGVFDIVYSTTSYAPGMALEGWKDALKFNVRVDGSYILPTADTIKYEENTKDDGFFCWKKGDWIYFRFRKRLVLEKEFTDVYFEEESINSIADKIYTMQCGLPVCGIEVDFQLPSEYVFRKDRFVSPEIAFNGLPEGVKSYLNASHIFEVKQKSDNHININLKEWVLPGIVFKVDWIEVPPPILRQ